jgi:hypothetical protein
VVNDSRPAGRHTRLLDPRAVPTPCVDLISALAERRGIAWHPANVRLAWTTESAPAPRGWLRRRDKPVTTVGCLDERCLAWCTEREGEHSPVIVRFDQVSVRDGTMLRLGVSARALASTGWDDEGLEIRGDLGGSDVGTVFLGIGSDAAALRVRETVLQAAGHTLEA